MGDGEGFCLRGVPVFCVDIIAVRTRDLDLLE